MSSQLFTITKEASAILREVSPADLDSFVKARAARMNSLDLRVMERPLLDDAKDSKDDYKSYDRRVTAHAADQKHLDHIQSGVFVLRTFGAGLRDQAEPKVSDTWGSH
jgi:hypothetical protein